MKKKMTLLMLLLLVPAMVLSFAACGQSENAPADDSAPGAIFASRLDYVGSKNGVMEASVILKAWVGSFNKNVTADDIVITVQNHADTETDEDFDPEKDMTAVSELKVVSNNGEELELSFVIPLDDLNADALSLLGYVGLEDGTMLDKDGNSVEVPEQLSIWTISEEHRTLTNASGDTQANPAGYVDLVSKGGYTVQFTVKYTNAEGRDVVYHTGRLQLGARDTYEFPEGAANYRVKCDVWNGSQWKIGYFEEIYSDVPFNCTFQTSGALPNPKLTCIKN